MDRYNHKDIEKKWQEKWENDKLYETPDPGSPEGDRIGNGAPYYTLVEFAYPSGDLHVGHWYAFSVPDIFARYKRMNGKTVMFPFGFDAFGLPAENAAIKRKENPRTWTYGNIDYMRKQLRTMGTSFDWSREVVTCDPEYYKWTQWLFLQFLKKGLAYHGEAVANWCPSCKTVLANEQVVNGSCERCGTDVEQRKMKQWMLKITDYADRLIDDLTDLDWPEPIKDAQRNWIGRSHGSTLTFQLKAKSQKLEASIDVFTTRPDTLFGATYLVLAPEHPFVLEQIRNPKSEIRNKDEVEEYIKKAKGKTELERQENKDKTGVELEGVKAINPANNEEISVFIADYVLAHYGTGAIMAVPAHDERDYEFAKKYNLPIQQVIMPRYIDETNPHQDGSKIVEREVGISIIYNPKINKYLCLKWKHEPWTTFITGGVDDGEDPVEGAKREILEETGYKNIELIAHLGKTRSEFFASHKGENRIANNTVLLFSLVDDTQDPIDEKEKEKHDLVWLSKEEIEECGMQHAEFETIWGCVDAGCLVPNTRDGVLINSGEFDGLTSEEAKEAITKKVGGKKEITYRLRDWLVSRQRYWGCPIPVIHCKKCGTVGVPEEELPVELPELSDFMPIGDGKSPLAKADDWVRVKCPSCGGDAERETDTLDTFIDSSWYFMRYADPHNTEAFADKKKLALWMPIDMYSGGAEHTTLHVLYSRFFQKALFDLGLVGDEEPFTVRRNRGIILGNDGQKMSKSRGNVVNPDEYVGEFGSDTVRMYLAFIGPYNVVGSYPWDPKSISGVRRFLDRAWRLADNLQPTTNNETEKALHVCIKKVTESITDFKFNTGVSALMTFLNTAEKEGIDRNMFETLLIVLAPFAPHITEELWHKLGHDDSVHKENWPSYDEEKLVSDTVTIAVSVNGKVRAELEVDANISEGDAKERALALDVIKKWVGEKKPSRVVYVPGRLVNVVLD